MAGIVSRSGYKDVPVSPYYRLGANGSIGGSVYWYGSVGERGSADYGPVSDDGVA